MPSPAKELMLLHLELMVNEERMASELHLPKCLGQHFLRKPKHSYGPKGFKVKQVKVSILRETASKGYKKLIMR